MIRNAVVLLDECNVQLSSGMSRYEAILLAALSRLRPVCLAGVTTVLGAIPLLKDVFWLGLAACRNYHGGHHLRHVADHVHGARAARDNVPSATRCLIGFIR